MSDVNRSWLQPGRGSPKLWPAAIGSAIDWPFNYQQHVRIRRSEAE
jgi:hypothetical protein